MAIAIDRELAGDINNPSFEVINYCIEEHEKELPRLQMLSDYYDGKPHKIGKEAKETPHQLDEIYVNNAKYVTDLMTGFIVGSPIAYTPPKGVDIQELLAVLDKMNIKKHDKELEKDLSVFGIAYELQYLNIIETDGKPDTLPKIACIDPRGMILVVDDTVDRNPLFAIRPREKEDLTRTKFWEVTIYTSKWTIIYTSKNKKLDESALMRKPSVKESFYGAVPVTEYRNNEEKQGDFEQQLSQIDGYNKLQTDRIKDKENFIKAIMILYGFTLPEESEHEEKSVDGTAVLEAPSKDLGASAEYVTNTFDESQIQVLVESVLDDFHKTSYVPNLNDEQFAGNISGEAMKYKLFGLLLVLAIKIGYFEDGLMQRLQLLANILNIKGKNIDVEGITIKFKPNLPINRSDIINQIKESQEFIPLLISLGWLDDIDNPEEVLEMLREQKEENIKLSQSALGVQAEDSHSDLDKLPKKKEGEEDDKSNLPEKE